MSTDLRVGDYAVFTGSPDIHTARVYEVVGIDISVVGGEPVKTTVDLIAADGWRYVKPVTVLANQLTRVAGPVGGRRRPDFYNREEPDIVY